MENSNNNQRHQGQQTLGNNVFCTDGTHNLQFLNGCVAQIGQPLPPLCLIVVSIDHRPEQQTPAGLLSVTNVVLRNADGHRIEASGWQTQAGVLASLSIGTAYWFMNCMARSRYQRLDCWYRIGVDGRNATIIPHPTQQAQPIQIQTGSGSNEVNGNVIGSRNQLRSNQTNEEDVNNNNNVNHSIDDSFVIERTTPMRNTLRNTRGEVCEIRFLPLEDNERPDLVMESLIQHLLDRVLEGHSSPMLVGLQLQPPGFDRPYVIRLRPPEQNNAAALAAAIERLNEQSAAGIDLLSGTTVTKVLAVWPLESVRADAQRGGACDLDNEHHLSHKVQSLVRVVNPNDRYCLARAVLLGLCDRETRMPNGGGREEFNTYARRQNQHGTQAIHLLTNAGVPVDKHMYTLEDVEQLQQYINNENGVGQIRLVVFEKEQEYRIVFKGEGTAARFNLCILLERGHFNYIGRIAQLFKVPGYCIDCERRADARYHAIGCKAACRLCFRFGAGYPCQRERLSDGRIGSRKCTECGFIFPNDNCYGYHLTTDAPAPIDGRGHRQRRSLCQWRRFCPTCGRVAYFGIHQCPPIRRATGPIDCFRCKGPHMLDEPCFIQPIGVAAPLPMLTPVRNNENNNNNIHDENDIDFIINNMGGEGDEDDIENGDDINDDDGGDDDDDEKDELLPLRLCFFDAETSQDRPLQLNNQVAHKHLCAEANADVEHVFNAQVDQLPITVEEIKTAQQEDELIKKVIKFTQTKWPNQGINAEMKPYFSGRHNFSLITGCLVFNGRSVIPPSLRSRTLKALHLAHPGIVRMKNLARSFVYWPSMDTDIETIVRGCSQCQQAAKQSPKQPLQPWPTTTSVFERIHIDLAGPCSDGNIYLVIIDTFSKWPEVFLLRQTSSQAIIDQLQWLFDRNSIKHIFSPPYHPQSNGAAERYVDFFKRQLKKCNGDKDWSPAELFLGRKLRTHISLMRPDRGQTRTGENNANAHKMKAQFDRKHGAKSVEFKIGEQVQFVNYQNAHKIITRHANAVRLSAANGTDHEWSTDEVIRPLQPHVPAPVHSPVRSPQGQKQNTPSPNHRMQPQERTDQMDQHQETEEQTPELRRSKRTTKKVRFLSPRPTGQRHEIRDRD
ncbi:hypothetical protein niasHT_019281 [Heterodera trifolii]|uniref:RNA-directed DNA polymerase n=1 Tax=Heterodera trifolii TaxID=157864 RepID=A0ABD2L0W2_9BILA